jgi:hypothetical protein
MESRAGGLVVGLAVGDGSGESDGSGETCATGNSDGSITGSWVSLAAGVGSSITETTGSGVGVASLDLAGAAISIVKTRPSDVALEPNMKARRGKTRVFKKATLPVAAMQLAYQLALDPTLNPIKSEGLSPYAPKVAHLECHC